MALLKESVQNVFNEIKGSVLELNIDEHFCNIIISVGNHNARNAALVCKKAVYNRIVKDKINLGDKVSVRFYVSSRKKHDRWYTNCNILELTKL